MSSLTKQERYSLHDYVESCPRTVREVLEQYGSEDAIIQHIGYRVNEKKWSIAGVSENGGGYGAREGDSYKSQLNRELGARIAKDFLDSTIKVEEKFERRD